MEEKWEMPENSIFGDFFLFLPAYEQPLNPSSAFIDKNVELGAFAMFAKGRNPPHHPAIFLGNPLTPLSFDW